MFLFCRKYIKSMLKPFFSALLFLCAYTVGHAQLNNASVFFHSGIQFKNNNQLPEAITAFNKALTLNKKFDSAYVELGHVYVKTGQIDNSISHFKKALLLNPTFTEALMAMGKIYKELKQNLDSALFYYSAAAKIDVANKEIFYGLAWTYNAKKDYDKAITNAIEVLKIDNTYRLAYGELGHAYRYSKKYAEGIEQFKKNLAVSVVDLALLYSGFCYTELNDKTGAMQQYEALKKINEKMAASLKKKIDSMQ